MLAAPAERLRQVPGCGEGVIAALKVTREAASHMLNADAMQRPAISNWQALLDYCRAVLQHEGIEQFRILFLDRKNQVTADEAQQRARIFIFSIWRSERKVTPFSTPFDRLKMRGGNRAVDMKSRGFGAD